MKMDIEEILKKHKSSLDLDEVPAGTWEGIQDNLHNSQNPKQFDQWWKVAAAIFLASTLGLIAYNFTLQQHVSELASLGDISEEYREIEDSYTEQINLISSNIAIESAAEDQDLAWLLEELKTMDEINDAYRKDIGTDADQELLVKALIDYYEKKIKLLRKLELEINRKENEKRNTDNISIS